MIPRSVYGLPVDYLNLSEKAYLKFEAFYGDQILEQGLINMLKMKVYICCKTLSNLTRIQKAHLKTRN